MKIGLRSRLLKLYEKALQFYEVCQEEGATEAGKKAAGYLSYKLHPRTLCGRLINAVQPSTAIWQKEWDICCILDGCRADTFESVFEGESTRIRSIASTSQTWIPRTFDQTDTSKLAYITANPFADRVNPDRFGYFHHEPVEQTDFGIETVAPEKVADHAIYVWRRKEKLDIDKMVVHFMQPHVPFRDAPSLFEEFSGTSTWGSEMWSKIESGEIEREAFFSAYRDNLQWVLQQGVEPIRQNCDGRIALTADHGNATGEWGYYGHPRHAPVSSVRVVPWAVIDGVDEGIRTPDIDQVQHSIDIDKQLSALGYK
jgi:hypothetical protein